MKKTILSVSMILLATVLGTATAADAKKDKKADNEKGFVSMFNGKDLTGWEGQPGGWWVEDGMITGQSTKEKPCSRAHYLMWRGGKPADFELRVSYRLVSGNSGIQIRSRELANWDTSGYQADMEDGQQWSGCLFEHTRGGVAMRGTSVVYEEDGTKHIKEIADPVKLLKRIKNGEWNEYRIIAKGSKIKLIINGIVMAEVDDRDKKNAAKSGVIALQMHPGPPMKVQFKDLRIKVFK